MSNNKVRKPNVVRGGTAVPLGRNYYYMSGRKHETGGIDIGRNPRTGLEVEDGEVMHVGKNEIKVFSSVPFLNGESPAEKVMGGDNPNDVFNAQESFKKRNKINDDGTKKKRMGGLSRNKDYGSKSKPYPSVKSGDFAGGGRSYPIPTKADAVDALRLAGLHGRSDVRTKVYNKYPELRKKSKAGGLYSVTVDGKTSLRMIPSTGNWTKTDNNKRDKAQNGTIKYIPGVDYEVIKEDNIGNNLYIPGIINPNKLPTGTITPSVDTTLINEIYKDPKQFFRKVRNEKPLQERKSYIGMPYYEDDYINVSIPNPEDEVLKQRIKEYSNKNASIFDAKRNIGLFEDGIGIKSGLINAGWSHGNPIKLKTLVDVPKMPYYNLNKIKTNNSKGKINKKGNTTTSNNITGSNDFKSLTPYTYKPTIEKVDNINVNYGKAPTRIDRVKYKGKQFINSAKDFISKNPDIINDSIGLTSNIIGSLISHSANKNMLNKLKYSDTPIARSATKLKTRININPQLDKMRETLAAYERDIDNNTASSRVALARKQRARLANMLATNELYGNKENMETELINKDKLNQQSVAHANIADYNRWAESRAAFRNAILEKKAENDVALVETLNAGVQDLIGRREKRKSENQTIAAMALANPNLPIEMLYSQGLVNKKTYEAYKKAYRNKKKND